jgi:hypothetical protein
MRVAMFGAIAIVVMAALVALFSSQHPLTKPSAISSVVLIAAVAIQRINGIQRWLAAPKMRRRDQVEALTQEALIELCMNKRLSADVLEFRIHVWEVPRWYRRLFPYNFRIRLKAIVTKAPFRPFSKWVIRPTLNRVASVGLTKVPTTGIRFRKGVGIVGACLAANDRAEFLTLDISDATYKQALDAPDEATWTSYGTKITHGLSQKDAKKLSHSYGQVLARVIQDPHTGEGIGCITISVKDPKPSVLPVVNGEQIRRKLSALSAGVGALLS